MGTNKGPAVALETAQSSDCQVEEIEEKVDALLAALNPRVLQRYQEQTNVNKAMAIQHYREVIKYLLAGVEYPGEEYFFTPSSVVDDAWHNFILFTQEYGEWCMEHLGQFVHHVPCMEGEVFDQEKVTAGNEILVNVYGVDKKIWAFDSSDCGTCGQGQPCGQGSCTKCGPK